MPLTATLVSALKNKILFGVGSGRIWSAKEHLNSERGLRTRYALPCIVRVFNGVQWRVETSEGTESPPSPCPLPQERETAAGAWVVRAVNPSGLNLYAVLVRVRPVRKASELVRRPVKGEETDRSTSPDTFFSKNENFRSITDLLYRLFVVSARENFLKRNAICRFNTRKRSVLKGATGQEPTPFRAVI